MLIDRVFEATADHITAHRVKQHKANCKRTMPVIHIYMTSRFYIKCVTEIHNQQGSVSTKAYEFYHRKKVYDNPVFVIESDDNHPDFSVFTTC